MPRNDVNLVKTKIYCNKTVEWIEDFIQRVTFDSYNRN